MRSTGNAVSAEAADCELIVKDVSLNFGGVKALQSVSLSVEAGEFVGLMGANGAGKTTLINCISRVLQPSSGRISFNGLDVLRLPAHEIARVGISRTFQDLDFFNSIPDMMVVDYLKLGQFPQFQGAVFGDGLQGPKSKHIEKEMKTRARKILEFFREMRLLFEPDEKERGYPTLYGRDGAPDLLDVEFGPIGMLSFAWRRRLDLARALVSNPRLLLLDEPAQGLPPFEIENLGKILKHIKKEFGVGALIVEHNVATLLEISDRIVVMDHGQKIAEGPPKVISRHPEVMKVYLGSTGSTAEDMLSSVSEVDKRRDAKPLLEVKNIDLFYGQAQVLFSVSLEVYPGEVVSILGTNGSGKSSTLRAVGGRERPTVGDVYFKGEILPPSWPEAAVHRGIQYVPQGHMIFPNLTVKDNLRIGGFPAENKGHTLTSGYEKVFDYFPQLHGLQEVLATNLSGGQQQMLAIAQALMGRPDLLMLDEPSLGLAPVFVDTIFAIIKRISKEEKCAILLVEQNVLRTLSVSDYVYVVSSGSIISQAPAAEYIKDNSIIKRNLGFFL